MSSVILVTGASSRFAAAMARALAHRARLVRSILFACASLGASIALRHLAAAQGAHSGTVDYRWSVIAPHIYAIRWTEADGGAVMHIDDFNKDISRSYYIPAGGTLFESWAPLRRAR